VNGWDRATLWKEQLDENDVGQILQEVEAGKCPKWKDISDYSSIYKSVWASYNSLVVRDGVLERKWESVDTRLKIAQIVLGGRNSRKYSVSSVADLRKVIWKSIKPWRRSNSDTTGYVRGPKSKGDAKRVTPAYEAEVPEPGAWWLCLMAGHRSKRLLGTGLRPVTTDEPTPRDSRGSRLSCSHPWQALARWWSPSTVRSARSSFIPGRRLWWSAWTHWPHISVLLGTNSAVLTKIGREEAGHMLACACLLYIEGSRTPLLVDSSRNLKRLVRSQKHRTIREILRA
jgi:hypothetical protein